MLRMMVAGFCGALLFPLMANAQDGASGVAGNELPAEAAPLEEGRQRIGYGRLFTNDFLADGRDRWRTGSIGSSRIWGYGWDGTAPSAFGDLLELRLHGQIIAPSKLSNPDASDRPWAGSLSAGLHSHVQRGDMEFALGAGLVMTGPQTRLDDFQDWLHDLVSAPRPSDAVLDAQIPDRIRPILVAEAGRSFELGDAVALRPFAEVRAGDEALLRVGADLTIGSVGQGELRVRDEVTGQRYRAVTGDADGLSFTLGGDIAYVADSIYLPEDRGYELTSHRDRIRAGLHWQHQDTTLFYGVTYLGKEFSAQGEGQVTGSLRLRILF